MRKPLYLALLLATAPLVFASDAEHAVIHTVLKAVARANHSHGIAPAAVRSMTAGGCDSFATQWIKKVRGGVIGGELASSYQKVNAEPEAVTDFLPKLTKDVDVNEPYDFEKINEELPGAQSLIVFSRPAFDNLHSVAFVRADVIPKSGTATTTFYELEHQPDDTWKLGHMAMLTYVAARHSDVHLR